MSTRNPTLATAQLIRLPAYRQLDTASQRVTRAREGGDVGAGERETHNPAPLTTSVRQDGVVCGRLYCNTPSIPDNDSANNANCTQLPDRYSVGSEWEQARRKQATERGYAYVPPSDVRTANGQEPDTDCLRTDGELAKMCAIGFKHYPQYQRWLVLHDCSRSGGQGFTFRELMDTCQRLGVKGCETYTRRVIRKGIGFYWNYDPDTDTIYPVGYLELCKRAIQYAYDLGLHDLYLYGNHPGQRRDMYVSVSGAGADFEGAVLAAWYGAHGCPTISRHTLLILLNRDARSIRRMERRACIRITYNEAQTTDPAAVPLNADGSLRGDVSHANGVWSYRLPNSYTPRMTRQHHRRGQGRKAACWFKHWLENLRLPGDQRAEGHGITMSFGKLNRIVRYYCETDRALNASRKRGNGEVLYVATVGRNKGAIWCVDAQYSDIPV